MNAVEGSRIQRLTRFAAGVAVNLTMALLLSAPFLLAELYLHWSGALQGILWRKDDIGYIFAFFLFLRVSRRSGHAYLWVFALMLLLQFSEIAYHLLAGTFYGPAELALLSRQTDNDVWITLSDSSTLRLFLPLAGITLATALLTLLLQSKSAALSLSAGKKWGYGLLLFWLLVPFIHAYTEDNSMRFDPDPGKTAFRNGVNAIAYHTVWDRLFEQGGAGSREYAPYRVDRVASPIAGDKVNLVIIMGESITYTHMGLYGYPHDTTPFLSSLARASDLFWLPGVSSGVSTHVSIPMFFNVQYEPDNRTHIASGRSNLYRLAKTQGYQTAFLSSQEMYAIASQVSLGAVDIWRELKHIENAPGSYDQRLLNTLRQLPLDWRQPFMLTLNPRAGHIPYANFVPPDRLRFAKGLSRGKYDRYMQASYDDAMAYFDWVVGEIIQLLAQRTDRPTVIVITSDHGQRLGETGGYGHNTLEFGSARVPFIYHGLNTPTALDALPAELPCPATHYDVGRFLARLLGYRVESPEHRQDDSYFLNGVDISGRGGYRGYRRAEAVSAQTCQR
ncbi:MAG: sulfatase-like hydrolase/transferase [Gammaproteobacteria bacterium]|nr:sulfatase-like hydrolase/transferase [Gammaproteobacteria bacterium]